MNTSLSRGGLLAGLGALGVAGIPLPAPAAACTLTPEQTLGPFFVDEKLQRSDLTANATEGAVRGGVPLTLALTIQQFGAGGCAALKGAQVDIWHTDAVGVYSDERSENTVGKTFLRGYQLTDASGLVRFKTIYPGWYRGRTAHIHVLIRTPAANAAYQYATQLYFDQALTNAIAGSVEAYKSRGTPGVTNARDGIYTPATQLVLAGTPASGFTSSFTIGLKG